MPTIRRTEPVEPSTASLEAQSLEVRILAHRAELLNTLAPGIMHHLANAGQGLEAAQTSPEAIAQVAIRLEKARRVLATLVSELTIGPDTDPGESHASVDEVLSEVEALLGCQITLPRVRVAFAAHAPLPTARIRADHLRDALTAVVTNAKEAMAGSPSGEILVSVETSAEWITISVADEGPGIDLTTLARLFKPYNSTKPGGHHLGLGLSLASELLTRAGGDLSVTASEAQPHTRIRMRIPVVPPNAGAGSDSVVPDARGKPSPAPTESHGGPGGHGGDLAAA
jgi:C4-dicarboxylate-specific signal transduction histidine kinase